MIEGAKLCNIKSDKNACGVVGCKECRMHGTGECRVPEAYVCGVEDALTKYIDIIMANIKFVEYVGITVVSTDEMRSIVADIVEKVRGNMYEDEIKREL